MKSDRIL